MWSKRGHRGDTLEDLLEYTHQYYHQLKLCRVDKISTPVKVVEIDGQGMVTKAFFEKKSTVDFIGIVQGVFVAFDAKETHLKSLPLSNIHTHQLDYMQDVVSQGGLAFFIVHFKTYDVYTLLPFEHICSHLKNTHRKSIPFTDIEEKWHIPSLKGGSVLNYLETLNTYVASKPHLG